MEKKKIQQKKTIKNADKYQYLGTPFNVMTRKDMIAALVEFVDLYESTDKTLTAQIEENLGLWQDRCHNIFLLAKVNQIIERQKLYDSDETKYPNLVRAIRELLELPQRLH